jgi:hypothetical protein
MEGHRRDKEERAEVKHEKQEERRRDEMAREWEEEWRDERKGERKEEKREEERRDERRDERKEEKREERRPAVPTQSGGTDITGTAMIGLAVVFVLSILFILTGNIFSFFVFALLIGILLFVLFQYGFVKINTNGNELDITYFPVPDPPPPGPADAPSTAGGSPPPSSDLPSGNQVFYVGDNTFTYDKAENVCKAFGAELATYSQIEQAYNAGAEWCGYGWSVGGLALFPTQEASWERRQLQETNEERRQKCGRPGINGGYFEPSMKFGVNCYGPRPAKRPSDDRRETRQQSAVDRFIAFLKDHLGDLQIFPFNSTSWSAPVESFGLDETDTLTAGVVKDLQSV